MCFGCKSELEKTLGQPGLLRLGKTFRSLKVQFDQALGLEGHCRPVGLWRLGGTIAHTQLQYICAI